MKAEWFGTMKGEEKENFRLSILNSEKVLDKLREIVYNRLKDRRNVTTSSYANSAWCYEQAHRNGAVEELERIIGLLNISDSPLDVDNS